jgi:hypothetical protein
MIDHTKIVAAEEYYERAGYQKLDVPWVIGREAYCATFPEHAFPFFTLGGFLPASGEQSFIQLMLDGKLPAGKYQCTTPCFRDEQEYNELHLPYFYKVELILVGSSSYYNTIKDAEGFFIDYCEIHREPINSDQVDIVEATTCIELGSYGRRQFKDFCWVYGTGLAEPRLSQVLAKLQTPR